MKTVEGIPFIKPPSPPSEAWKEWCRQLQIKVAAAQERRAKWLEAQKAKEANGVD